MSSIPFIAGHSLQVKIKLIARRATAALLFSALAACGGGGGGGTSFPVVPIAQPPAPSQPDTPTPPAPITYQATLTPTAGEITVGKTLQLKASLVDSQGNNIANPPTVFASSDLAVASVASLEGSEGTGVVTGVAKGSVLITAKVTAPDGTVLSQQATVTVVAAPLTYKLVLPNPTINLQYNQPMTVSATILASDGTDATAAASGWSWSSSDTTVVAVTPSGSSASLLASNARPQAASAVITVQASTPSGSVVSGQIASTALLHYTYQTILSATSAKVASDRPAVITAQVLRSDGADLTASVQNLNWVLPAPGSTSLAMTLSNNNTTATFTSTRPDLDVDPSDPPVPDAGVQTDVSVQASDSPPATLAVTEFAQYTNVVAGGPLSKPAGTTFTIGLKRFHSSADGSPEVTSECDSSLIAGLPQGGTVGNDIPNPSGLFDVYSPSIGSYALSFQSICTNNVPPHLWTLIFTGY